MPNYIDPSRVSHRYPVYKVQTCSGQPLEIAPGGTNTDAFGRFRVSNPLTLFDSSHRYSVNGHWSTLTGVSGTVTFNTSGGLVDLSIGTVSGSKVYRETHRVFPYQPGKSLLLLNTFVMSPAQPNLRQRAGFFGTNNGIYFQISGSTVSMVERSFVTGSVTESVIPQSQWNGDRLDGTGPSGLTLDPTKAQIFWVDIEWLGVGTVRTGFVIDGKFITCHSFHHANLVPGTYITTASLPVRYEIEALNTLSASGTLKQVCSSVISEGGYELRGDSNSISHPLSEPRTLTSSGVFYPVAAIRLKASPDRLDAVVIPNALSLFGQGNNAVFNWKVIQGGTVSGGTWATTGSGSPVEYNLSGTSISGGETMAAGYISSNTQSQTPLQITTNQLFKYQLERNSFTSTPMEFIFAVAGNADGHTCYASIDWEEISR